MIKIIFFAVPFVLFLESGDKNERFVEMETCDLFDYN